MRRILMALGAAAALSACATTSGPGGAAVTDASREDMFALRIDVGRVGVFNDKIATVLAKLPDPPEAAPGATEAETQASMAAADLRGAASAIRSITLEYLKLEGEACAAGKLADVACKGGGAPTWLAEPANRPVAAAEVVRRLNWLQQRMAPLLDSACEKGKTLVPEEEGGGELFCSVE